MVMLSVISNFCSIPSGGSPGLVVVDAFSATSSIRRNNVNIGFRTSPFATSTTTRARSAIATSRATPLFVKNETANKVATSTSEEEDTKSIFEPGGGPTVIITPDETSEEIYNSAIKRTVAWIAAAIVFGGGISLTAGQEISEQFFAGYLLEQSLSIDNLLVFLLLFDYFKVPIENQDRVLNYGIIGAVVMRAFMISLGAVALHQFHVILLGFAAVLIYSSANVLLGGDDEEEEDMSENSIVKFSKKLFDATDQYDGNKFFTMVEGVKKATPLFICMVAVEISDVVFAVDSIPAVFGVTEDPLVVFSSNMFAIMGLRSLYTILSKAASDLEYLEPAVAVVLGFIGTKMVGEYFGIMIPTEFSLGVVATCLSSGIGFSIWSKNKAGEECEG
jgi:TerC family integral membrane protein